MPESSSPTPEQTPTATEGATAVQDASTGEERDPEALKPAGTIDPKLGRVITPSGEVVLTGDVGDPEPEKLGSERRLWVEELTRVSLALSFVLLFAGTIIWACCAATGATPPHWEHAKELLQSLLPAETSLLGGAVAFYFATKTGK
jgi:hypothetical protein